jgi:hypothetical protein
MVGKKKVKTGRETSARKVGGVRRLRKNNREDEFDQSTLCARMEVS